ncbi:hypothetical protein L1987_40898 [Smallanthus sonchifolius]|uniref:Uncharacterized protein n=1 Tax=Smallanthus sonchifolius TaxID=185202 RepID=A0ACB9GTA6_9ASTR|nr:hypothetical protein L1987_40898 [Smallanthus sonchifolius]
MSGGGTQNGLRKALGAIKDSTTVNIAKVSSDYKEVDINIVKATNHVERPAKEKHIRAIFAAISATRPRADVAYCIHALARRLSKTHNWAVALKTLIVIHRALREVDPTFQEELLNYGRSRNHVLNLSYFKDDSSPNAWDYSGWVRTYALYLEERLECFRVLKYDVETDRPPQGAAVHNFVIQLALSMVASDSIKIYHAISDGSANLVDKFFEMQRHEALKALDIYRRAGQQVERLSEFYEICKNIDIGRGETFIKIEQPPSSFLQTMEEYVKEAPRASNVRKDLVVDGKPKAILAIEYKKEAEVPEVPSEPSPPAQPVPDPVQVEVPATEPPPDLLSLDDPVTEASEFDQKNSLALAIMPAVDQPTSTATTSVNGTLGWELALVTAPSSNGSATSASKLAGGLDKLTLDSLYDDAIRRTNQNVSYNPWEQGPMAGAMMPHQTAPDPFYASTGIATPHNILMAQQQAFIFQQQQQMMMMSQPLPQQGSNPFANPYGASPHPYGSGLPVQSYNPYSGLM